VQSDSVLGDSLLVRPDIMGKQNYHLSHEDLEQPVLVKKSPRAKRMTLRVSPARRDVTLTIPHRTSANKAKAFVSKHVEWLNQQIGDLPCPAPFVHGVVIPFEGVLHQLDFYGPRDQASKGRPVVETIADEDLAILRVLGQKEHAPRRLTDWLKGQARQRLSVRVAHHADFLDLSYSRIGVRDQVSRWGSCSSSGTLSFSWRLIFAPSHVLDYVAAHEVAHLREMNHSPRFWALVAKTMPELEQSRHWLRAHGQDLHRYGASE
jgi:predicted metal-dependent hydrolase